MNNNILRSRTIQVVYQSQRTPYTQSQSPGHRTEYPANSQQYQLPYTHKNKHTHEGHSSFIIEDMRELYKNLLAVESIVNTCCPQARSDPN